MAIGPDCIEDKFKEELREFEEIIDRNLQNASFRNGGNTVSVTVPRGMEDSHFLVLRKTYISAGWKNVRREYGHQRDPLNEIIFEK